MFAWKKRLGQEGTDRRRSVDWKKPFKWNASAQVDHDAYNMFKLGVGLEKAGPGPSRPCVFPSLCDWLDDEVPIEWLADFLKLIHDTPNLDWQLLTKRPENFYNRLGAAVESLRGDFRAFGWACDWQNLHAPTNVWIGVSVENQKYADARLEAFRAIPAAVKFVSYEPALEQVNWEGWEFVHQIIFGGESGSNRRPCEVEWAKSTMEFCIANQIAFFCKQDTHRLPGQQGRIPPEIFNLKHFPVVGARPVA